MELNIIEKENKLFINFKSPDKSEFFDMLDKIKTLNGRIYNSLTKKWEIPNVEINRKKLRNWGFKLDIKESEKKEDNIKKSVYFSLCPLYNILKNNGGWENAKRSLSKNKKTIRAGKNKFSEGEDKRSTIKSKRKIDKTWCRSRMEEESFRSNKKGYAQERCKRETFKRVKKSKREIWSKLQRWEWTRTDRNNKNDKKHICAKWVKNRISCENKENKKQILKCTRCIQNRLCLSQIKDSNRSRWGFSQKFSSKGKRQQKNKSVAEPWLDCNTIEALKIFPDKYYYLIDILFPFQIQDIINLKNKAGRALIASEMGTGKTLISLSYLCVDEKFPVLIVCPATLKLNWEAEILKWTKLNNIYVVNGRSDTIPLRSDIIIINYDIIQDYVEQIKNLNIEIMILDEFHHCRSPKTKRTKAVKKIGKDIKQIIALTGTPILNKPIEMFTTLNLLRPDLFPSYFRFANRYCDPKHNGFGMTYNGATNIEELHEILVKEVMIRRLKKDVLKDLPEKLISIIPLEIDNKNEYKKAENDFSSWLLEKEKKVVKVEALTRIEKLKQLAVEGKLKQIEEWIKNVLEESDKLVIMCTHHFTVDYLTEKFKNISVKLDGRDSEKNKNEAVKNFQEDKNIKLFIGNIKAAGVGITLTAADKLAFIELGWNPSEHDQASDRIHRIGQKNSCNIYYIIAKNTIEEDIITLIDEKRKIVDAVHDGKITDDENLLNKLLEKYYKN